jgi:sporulation protein YlmC with PRC-barrel domain
MLRETTDIFGYSLAARDGEIGRVKDIYFDDQEWAIRYLVADTYKWLPGRKVLLSPFSVKGIRDEDKLVDIDLTRQQIENSPTIDHDMPVSRQFEAEYYRYYQWPLYWHGAGLWGPLSQPIAGYGHPTDPPGFQPKETNPHLRDFREVAGYHIKARDGEIGHVEDMAFDDEDWALRYIIIDTKNWWPGKKVVLSVDWITEISFERSEVSVDVDRDKIQRAPEHDFDKPFTREYETLLYHYYNREPYWDTQKRMAA